MLLGEDRDAWLFDRESTMVDLIDSLTGQARQRIWLYDRVLDHDLYVRLRFRELISGLARRHQFNNLVTALDQRLVIVNQKPHVTEPMSTGQAGYQFPEAQAVIEIMVQHPVIQPDPLTRLASQGVDQIYHGALAVKQPGVPIFTQQQGILRG